jgi:hypothetical protein
LRGKLMHVFVFGAYRQKCLEIAQILESRCNTIGQAALMGILSVVAVAWLLADEGANQSLYQRSWL